MAYTHRRADKELVQQVLLDDPEFLRNIVQRALQQLLEAEITEHVGAAPYERTESRKGQRNGYKPRKLKTRVGTLELLVPQDREGTFSTQLFARYQRNEKALILALMEISPEPGVPEDEILANAGRQDAKRCGHLRHGRHRHEDLRPGYLPQEEPS